MDLRKDNWTCIQVPMAKQGIALCKRNHTTVKHALIDGCMDMPYLDKRVVKAVLAREFTGDKRFPMWVTIWKDEWPAVSRALRAGDESPTAAYNLFMRQMRRGGVQT